MSEQDSHYGALTEKELKQEWRTPDGIWTFLNSIWRFTLDGAADQFNTKCELFNSLEQPDRHRWEDHRVFCNPPYQLVEPWLVRGFESAARGSLAVLLVPSRLDQQWFHRWAARGLVLVPDHRIQFQKPPDDRIKQTSNREASLIVVFSPSTLNENPRKLQMQSMVMPR